MSENPSCVHCGQSVDILGGTEEYVITNKDQGVPKDQWAYAHLECHADTPETAANRERNGVAV